MRLVSFTVTKYRSIKTAHKIGVGRLTVLVGPNNEGKSNLLRALVTAMRVLTSTRFNIPGQTGLGAFRMRQQFKYDWVRDFPQDLQSTQPQGKSEITLEFELTPKAILEFRRTIRSELNGTLPIRISLGPDSDTKIAVVKRGPGGKALTTKSRAIAEFVSHHINFEHIPAVRTASSAQEIVSTMVEKELESLESDPAYQKALNAIATLQQPVLERLSSSIKSTLVKFLPDVADVKVQISVEDRYKALRRNCKIIVDDGTPTNLEHKGDGVQSLAALGIMRHASDSTATGRNLIIAIEEPESHLHPGAIHELRQVLQELADKHQVVITTHNPLFVDRAALCNNIIVKDNRARSARSIEELRSALGVRASDNLRHAELVLLVEGENDRKAIGALLRANSTPCKQALDSGAIAIDTLSGATNLAYKASLIRSALSLVHAFLDNDASAHDAFDRARTEGLLSDGEVNWTTCLGMREAELEDLYNPDLYSKMVEQIYRVILTVPEFRAQRKWSDRMERTFRGQGRHWDDRVAKDVKAKVADLVVSNPEQALSAARKSAFEGLIRTLEARIGELKRIGRS